jgi:tetratricopeptide (TPR) repeat protein
VAIKRPASALLSKYLAQYRRQPSSRVFAPLAESYRKLGMIDEALKILKEGIKRHPTYVLGYLVLSQCYFDQKKFDQTYDLLRPLISNNRDNLSLQKLFGQVCLNLGHNEEALETYKFLLFLNPTDKFYAHQVKKLEDDLVPTETKISKSLIARSPKPSGPFDSQEDDWSMVSFENKNQVPQSEDQWVVEKPKETVIDKFNNENDWQVMSRSIDDDFFSDDEVSPEDSDLPDHQQVAPMASHTLVDLYIAQNHIEPAIDLLKSIIRANPNDERSKIKLNEIETSMVNLSYKSTESAGHDELLRIIEDKVHLPDIGKIEKAYRLFLQHLQLTADEKTSLA